MLDFSFGQQKICTIGAGTRDVFVKSEHFEQHKDPKSPTGYDACFPLGSKINIDDIFFETGGGATNAAITFTRSNLKTSCIYKVGDDDNGKVIAKILKQNRVNIKHAQIDPKLKTGYSVIILSGTGQRSILVHRGAARAISADRIPKLRNTWIYLTSLGGNKLALKKIIALTDHKNNHLAWNPGNAELALGLKYLKPWFKKTDILILNREEAATVADCSPKELKKIITALGALPKTALVVTDGAKGAYAHDCQNNKTYYTRALPGERINTTGAGDAFGSGFTAAYIKTHDIKTGLAAGSINSLGVITHMGAKAGIFKHFPAETSLQKVKITSARL